MKRIKVLHIITNLSIGGAQDNTLITVDKLDKNHYDVTLLCGHEGKWIERALSLKDVRVIFIDELIRKIHLVYDFIAFIKLYHIIKHEKFTIVHTHSSKAGFLGRIAAKTAGCPIVIHTIHGFPFHEFMHPLIKKLFIFLERFLSKFSDILITVSHLNLEKAIALKLGSADKFVNIYSGISFDRFSESVNILRKKKELGIEEGEKIIGMVGRLSRQKAPQYFIQAIPEVIQAYPNTRFLLVGDGKLRGKLVKLTEELGVEEKVAFLGFRDDIPEILRILDLFVLTSLWEGLGRSLTEAMYAACPVVATRVEGVPELVTDGVTGILVQPKDSHAIAKGIIDLLKHPQKAREIGEAARRRVSKDFTAEQMIQQIEQLYKKMLKGEILHTS